MLTHLDETLSALSVAEAQHNPEHFLECTRQAVSAFPEDDFIFMKFCSALDENGRRAEAIDALYLGLKAKPQSDKLVGLLAYMLSKAGRFDKLDKLMKKYFSDLSRGYAERRRSDVAITVGSFCISSLYRDDISEMQIASIHKRAGEIIQRGVKPLPQIRSWDHEKPKIGFVSGDISRHAVGNFIIEVFKRFDFSAYDVYIYFNEAGRGKKAYDDVTDQVKALPLTFKSFSDDKNAQGIATIIRENEIDILIDLSGHTGGNFLSVFAYKPAPVQASWVGYPDSTGLTTMDYKLTDVFCEPELEKSVFRYTELLYRFDRTFSCYKCFVEAFPANAPPCIENNHVTFGSFNNTRKINATTVKYWSHILSEVPGSRIMLKAPGLSQMQEKIRIFAEMKKHGISVDRIDFVGARQSQEEHLEFYNKIDIALDTFPYNGTTTTCEALWMGVPVVTRAGSTHTSRVSGSILSSIGAGELIAESWKDFVVKARDLASNTDRVRLYKQTLREKMCSSEICDADGMVAHLGQFIQAALARNRSDDAAAVKYK